MRFVLDRKGDVAEPKCGFSRKAVALLQEQSIQFTTFDILSDEDVRQGLKTFSDWPTYPQLYAQGKLVGGLDIMQELAEVSEPSRPTYFKPGFNNERAHAPGRGAKRHADGRN